MDGVKSNRKHFEIMVMVEEVMRLLASQPSVHVREHAFDFVEVRAIDL